MNYENLSLFYPAVLTIVVFVLWYMIFILTGKNRLRENGAGEVRHFVILKIAGFILFGIVPFFLTRFYFRDISSAINIIPAVWPVAWYQWVLLFALCAIIAVLVGRLGLTSKPEMQEMYPELRLSEWKWHHIIINVTGWIVYLAGYEFLFRGVLLKGMLIHSGIWVAVIVNIILYSSAHFYKNRKELIASIPFGVVLCIAAIASDSVLLPFFLHLTIALSGEMFALRSNKQMNCTLFKRS